MDKIAINLLAGINQIKIYHFQTPSYARHKTSDKLFTHLVDNMDRFMEVLQGIVGERVYFKIDNITIANMNDDNIVNFLNIFKEWLTVDLLEHLAVLNALSTDLMTIRDEMLSDINQTMYLFTFL